MAINLDNIRKQMGRVEDAYAGAELHSRPQSLSPAEIILNPNNSAAEHDTEESVRRCADTIEVAGLIHPLTVMKISEHQYMLLSGERRYKAITTHLHWDYIPCMVYEQHLSDDQKTVITNIANLEAREYSAAKKLELYQQLDAAYRNMKERGEFKGSISRKIAEIMHVSDRQIRKYKKICEEMDVEQLKSVTSISAAAQQFRKPKKEEKSGTEFRFLETPTGEKSGTEFRFSETPTEEKSGTEFRFSETPTEEKSGTEFRFSETPTGEKSGTEFRFLEISNKNESSATCQCVSCTCTGCHEECYGHCQGCGNKTTDCNSYQTEGEKRRSDQQEPSAEATESSIERAATERALAAITELMMLVKSSNISDKAKQHLYAAHAELVKYSSAAGLLTNKEE